MHFFQTEYMSFPGSDSITCILFDPELAITSMSKYSNIFPVSSTDRINI